MTKPRTAIPRELFGILGSFPGASAVQTAWNRHFAVTGRDAFLARYPSTVDELPERLSQMFHFDRRMYLVAPRLQAAIVPLLDTVDGEPVSIVVNRGGVLHGVPWSDSFGEPAAIEAILRLC